jgi:hypothetical protein
MTCRRLRKYYGLTQSRSPTITISTPTQPNKNTLMTIYNISSQQIVTRQITEEQMVIDVHGLPKGVYVVRITNDRIVQVEKFVKQ